MAGSRAPVDRAALELQLEAKKYAEMADKLAADPYFRQAVAKVAVSSFAWGLFDRFDGDVFSREAIAQEMIEQAAAIYRAVGSPKHLAPAANAFEPTQD
jgi:hypothetical protein